LLSHCSYGRQKADAVLIHGAARLRMELGLHEPTVSLLWPEDSDGHPQSTSSISAASVQALLSELEAQLKTLYSPSFSL
jgi:hypothetical protein